MTLQAVSVRFEAPATPGAAMTRFLAFDTSTDVMSIALTDGVRLWQHTGPGGAAASTTLIPAIFALLAQAESDAGLTLDTLDAIAFGQGPGSFTGLRTACAVAQGLAFGACGGAGLPVLPIPTLLALAEEARFQVFGAPASLAGSDNDAPQRITALLDARMDEMYVQTFVWHQGLLAVQMDSRAGHPHQDVHMIRPENWLLDEAPEPAALLAGNVFTVYGQRLPDLAGHVCVTVLPTATAMLRLAPALAARGACVAADQALPLYVRNKVAQTTAERALVAAEKAAKALQALQSTPAVPLASVGSAGQPAPHPTAPNPLHSRLDRPESTAL